MSLIFDLPGAAVSLYNGPSLFYCCFCRSFLPGHRFRPSHRRHAKNWRACTKCHNQMYPDGRAKYRAALKEKVFTLLGAFCAHCGFSDKRALQLDHKAGDGAEDRATKYPDWPYLDALKNPDKYQILCANCNWIKRVEDGECKSVRWLRNA